MNNAELIFKRGDVFWFEKNYVVEEPGKSPDEKPKLRAESIIVPAVVVSNNQINEKSQKIDIVWVTKNPKRPTETNVKIESLKEPSTAVCGFIHSIEKDRATFWIGRCTAEEMDCIDKAIMIALGLTTRGMHAVIETKPASSSDTISETTDAMLEEINGLVEENEQLKAEKADLLRDKEVYRKIIERTLR